MSDPDNIDIENKKYKLGGTISISDEEFSVEEFSVEDLPDSISNLVNEQDFEVLNNKLFSSSSENSDDDPPPLEELHPLDDNIIDSNDIINTKSYLLDKIDNLKKTSILDNIDKFPTIKALYGTEVYNKIIDEKNIIESNVNDSLTTDGLSVIAISKLINNKEVSKLQNYINCQFCTKYYPDFITVPYDSGTCCWHCLFFLNNNNLENIETMYKINLNNYLSFCTSDHNSEKCIRPDSCLICMSKIGVGLEDSCVTYNENDIEQFVNMIKDGEDDYNLTENLKFIVNI
jgi:hypothetical protein